MTDVPLTIALGEYDHVRDLTTGRVPVEGVTLRALQLPVEEIFARFWTYREWEVSEFSFGKYVSMVASGDRSLIALPVFPSRVFRHSSIYVSADTKVSRIEDLAGGRIGMPEWAQTAAIYSRGMLHHLYGVELSGVHWVQAGVNQAGRREKVSLTLPEGVEIERVADRSLNDMLMAGDLDAVLSARPPAGFSDGSGRLRRLVEDYPAVEREYCEQTGVFPIMHIVVLRADVHERHPWIGRNLTTAFEAAKDRSLERMRDVTASWIPLPWTAARMADAEALVGEDPWPYGIEANRTTLETFLRYAHEQGVCARLLEAEELFAPSSIASVRV